MRRSREISIDGCRKSRGAGITVLLPMLALLAGICGCGAGEALVDGIYGGVSDTVSGLISGTLLAAIGAGE